MMHMIKLCVGVATLEELEGYRAERAHWWGADYGEDVHVHRTRTMPKRRDEIEGQGSIYWVISGVVRCRQPILRLAEAIDDEGSRVLRHHHGARPGPRRRRAPSGRSRDGAILSPKDAPPDLDRGGLRRGGLDRDSPKNWRGSACI